MSTQHPEYIKVRGHVYQLVEAGKSFEEMIVEKFITDLAKEIQTNPFKLPPISKDDPTSIEHAQAAFIDQISERSKKYWARIMQLTKTQEQKQLQASLRKPR